MNSPVDREGVTCNAKPCRQGRCDVMNSPVDREGVTCNEQTGRV